MVCPDFTARQAGRQLPSRGAPPSFFGLLHSEANLSDRLRVRSDCSSVLEFLPLRTGASWATYPLWFTLSFLHRKPLDHR